MPVAMAWELRCVSPWPIVRAWAAARASAGVWELECADRPDDGVRLW